MLTTILAITLAQAGTPRKVVNLGPGVPVMISARFLGFAEKIDWQKQAGTKIEFKRTSESWPTSAMRYAMSIETQLQALFELQGRTVEAIPHAAPKVRTLVDQAAAVSISGESSYQLKVTPSVIADDPLRVNLVIELSAKKFKGLDLDVPYSITVKLSKRESLALAFPVDEKRDLKTQVQVVAIEATW